MSTSSEPKAIVKLPAFGEYIINPNNPDNLLDFPINPNIPEFHFILGFAKEDYDTNGRGTGHFTPTWKVHSFGAENIKKLKHENENVKVTVWISIGGVGTENPFNPVGIDVWLPNAKASLKKIIDDCNRSKVVCPCGKLIYGIDINYEVIITSNDTDFAGYIGQVISGLKNDGLIEMVSIAPSYQVQPHYQRLYVDHKKYIDWVNYKFYNQTVPSADNFKELYLKLSNDYHAAKLLAGFSTDPDYKGVTLEVFLEGCIDLLRNKSLAGIFVWNANNSAVSKTPFWVEEILQKLLVNSPH